VTTFAIRQYGDPVLRQVTKEVEEFDGRLAKLAEDMLETMYATEHGVGLAANQVGVQRRLFVYDVGAGPVVVVNPRIESASGEWDYDEGCLSVPGLSWPIVRPGSVRVIGCDVEGNQLAIEADELEGRVLQHEVDHLDGIVLVERLDADRRREAKARLRARALTL
jgi:peptide deformylase